MLIIDNEASLDLALNSPLAPSIKALLRLRFGQIISEGWTLADLATFIIVEPGDSLSQIEDRLTFPLFTDDAPNWEWIEQHGDLLEAPSSCPTMAMAKCC